MRRNKLNRFYSIVFEQVNIIETQADKGKLVVSTGHQASQALDFLPLRPIAKFKFNGSWYLTLELRRNRELERFANSFLESVVVGYSIDRSRFDEYFGCWKWQ